MAKINMCSQKWQFLDGGSQRATSATGSGLPAHGCGCRQGEEPQRAGTVGVRSLHMLAGGVVLGLLRDMVVVRLSLGEVLSMGGVGLGVEHVA